MTSQRISIIETSVAFMKAADWTPRYHTLHQHEAVAYTWGNIHMQTERKLKQEITKITLRPLPTLPSHSHILVSLILSVCLFIIVCFITQLWQYLLLFRKLCSVLVLLCLRPDPDAEVQRGGLAKQGIMD